MRRFPHIPDPYEPAKPHSGVYKPSANFPGPTARLEVVNSDGDLMGLLIIDASIADESFERAFRRILQRKDTGKQLRVV